MHTHIYSHTHTHSQNITKEVPWVGEAKYSMKYTGGWREREREILDKDTQETHKGCNMSSLLKVSSGRPSISIYLLHKDERYFWETEHKGLTGIYFGWSHHS